MRGVNLKSGAPGIIPKTNQKEAIAKAVDVSVDTLGQAPQVLKEDPALHTELKARKKTLHEASQEVKAKKQKQVALDAVGVSNLIKDKRVFNGFRKMAVSHAVPYSKQAGLAAALLEYANDHNKGKLTLPFLKDYEGYIPALVEHGTQMDETQYAQALIKKAQHDFERAAKEFHSLLLAMNHKAHLMIELRDKYSQIHFKIDKDLRWSIKFAKQEIDKLAQWSL
jgi:hypothetical protein